MKKMPLDFLFNATEAVKTQLMAAVSHTTTVSCTSTYTAFEHEGNVLVTKGNLHEQVDAPYCIEFDLRYNHGEIVINSQRIYNN